MKIKAPWLLLAIPVFGGIIAYNLKTGIAHGRCCTIYKATDPDGFWFIVYSEGFFVLLSLFFFFIAQAGDGWSDDG